MGELLVVAVGERRGVAVGDGRSGPAAAWVVAVPVPVGGGRVDDGRRRVVRAAVAGGRRVHDGGRGVGVRQLRGRAGPGLVVVDARAAVLRWERLRIGLGDGRRMGRVAR